MITQTGKDIQQAAHFLREGFPVAIPTETVYGLAANALNEDAVLKVFKLKNRPSFDPLIIHIPDPDELSKYVNNVPDGAKKLAGEFWPGPLTMLFEKKSVIPDLVTSGLNTVAVRIPDHPLTQQLLRSVKFPLAAPSANPFGYISPTSADHVLSHFEGAIPYILDGGLCKVGIESTIVGFENDKCIIHRLGGISVASIESCIGTVEERTSSVTVPNAPGQLLSHYAPSKPMYFYNEQLIKEITVPAAFICFQKPAFRITENFSIYELSPEGNLDEAAHNLFAVMREVDKSDVKVILCMKFPEEGLGRAINDRLRRAVSKA